MNGTVTRMPEQGVVRPHDGSITFSSMATSVSVRVLSPATDVDEQIAAVVDVFRDVERTCTRFDASSPLMVANASPNEWHVVPEVLLRAVAYAAAAHEATDGLFDPRVLTHLIDLGYDRTLPFDQGPLTLEREPVVTARLDEGRWRPEIDGRRSAIRLGPVPIDLGGIGKGLAVARASKLLRGSGLGYLINAGGDCSVGGEGPSDGRWLVGVEKPSNADELVAVLELCDQGCATSSTRRRKWQVNDRAVHHLIDPRTGSSSDGGLGAVTVFAADPMWAEVWSKTLFLVGAERIAAEATRRGLAALWIHEDGTVGSSPEMAPHLMWQESDVTQ